MELQPDNGPRSSLSIGPGFRRYNEFRREFARRFAEGIKKFAGNMSKNHQGEDQKICHKYAGGYRIGGMGFAKSSLGDSPKGSGSSLGTHQEIIGEKTKRLTASMPDIIGLAEVRS
ncbi:hypothetical protein B296_00016164 [Ensete ventricosum]|uniref:Uncharacterized protein n=1 Tax=Ensete ventricosum TaxID=4639 RepID=A0A426ZWX9_ENSVE|nr:hypothetical protein B296_00016164 [Ensete ventricosum]